MKKFFLIAGFLSLLIGCPQTSGTSSSFPVNLSTEQVVINYSNWLNDGAAVSWKLEPGSYRLEMTANNDGATAEWVGAACAKTQPMQQLTTDCNMPGTGQLIIMNPTTFGLGKSVSVTVKVTKK